VQGHCYWGAILLPAIVSFLKEAAAGQGQHKKIYDARQVGMVVGCQHLGIAQKLALRFVRDIQIPHLN
jgi:hypothetical protein